MSNNKYKRPKVYAALPVLNEPEYIKQVVNDILNQQQVETHLVICVNQPNEWWHLPDKWEACENNRTTLDYLTSLNESSITVIDKSSEGNGWIGRKHGVGWARKVAMDTAASMAGDDDLIISIDADTWYTPDYFNAVIDSFERNPSAVGFSAPYYHPVTGDETADRCILRYELYMRNYALNMLLIENPYSFSAIGSGMGCKAGIYRKVRGITPKLSGEDFYFIQKLRKLGSIIIDNEEVIYPASRFSNRVYFGTGPAMIRGREGNWSSYPFYKQELFNKVKETYDLFPELYHRDIQTPMDAFLRNELPVLDLWKPLRQNSTHVNQFVKAARQSVDALHILQYLKAMDKESTETEEEKLSRFIFDNFTPDIEITEILLTLCFNKTSVANLNLLRDFMFVNERSLQQKAQTA